MFFQAEDGIRVYKVTGVQTCALPILIVVVVIGILTAIAVPKFQQVKGRARAAALRADLRNLVTAQERSEERRVGKGSVWRRACAGRSNRVALDGCADDWTGQGTLVME